MFKYHTTANGETMLICEMEDDHLMNTIKMVSKRFLEYKKHQTETSGQSEYERHLYNRSSVSPKDLADKTKEIADLLAPYILEGVLRGYQLYPLVQETFGRKEAVPKVNNYSRITTGTVSLSTLEEMLDEDEEWED